jgi:hypothetical protein
MNTTKLQSWKRVVGQRVRRMTPADAAAAIARISAEGATMFHQDIRDLTGGFNSQNINFYVIRKLADRAKVKVQP